MEKSPMTNWWFLAECAPRRHNCGSVEREKHRQVRRISLMGALLCSRSRMNLSLIGPMGRTVREPNPATVTAMHDIEIVYCVP